MANWILAASTLGTQAATPSYYYAGLAGLVVAMAVAAVWAYRSWEEAHEELDPATKDELMEAFQQARLEGELDDQELARIRSRIESSQAPGEAERPRRRPTGGVN
ncbi:hypothetical protein [Paludisphaera rhizosphaerae]|uniref:hypothetical protein n=1 Tax=Paludisphaera rhizosphaerae TaxID=2711216 RepID=UPI0013ED01CC|nr:hypothetical protein [Paludisphaera rhizosphaerae]